MLATYGVPWRPLSNWRFSIRLGTHCDQALNLLFMCSEREQEQQPSDQISVSWKLSDCVWNSKDQRIFRNSCFSWLAHQVRSFTRTCFVVDFRKAVRATLILIPLLGLQFVLFPLRPEKHSHLLPVYLHTSACVTSFQVRLGVPRQPVIQATNNEKTKSRTQIMRQKVINRCSQRCAVAVIWESTRKNA